MKQLTLLLIVIATACAHGPVRPVPIDTAHDTCANCRMVISDARFAAEIIAPGEEPILFDDIGCLQAYQRTHARPADAVVFVVDHRTGGWIDAKRATFTQLPDADTPMGSRLVAEATP